MIGEHFETNEWEWLGSLVLACRHVDLVSVFCTKYFNYLFILKKKSKNWNLNDNAKAKGVELEASRTPVAY